jgi:hypothetical protein
MATARQYFTQGAGLESIIKSYNPDIALFSTFIEWSTDSKDVVNNTSTIKWAFKIETYDLSKWQTYKQTFGTAQSLLIGVTSNSSLNDIYVKIGNDVLYSATDSSVSVASNKIVTLASGELTLAHNDDGTLTPSFNTYIRVKDLYDETGEASINNGDLNYQCAASGSISLESVPRHALIYDAPNFTDEDSPVINYAVPSGMTAEVYIALDGQTEDITARTVTGSGDFTFIFTDDEKSKFLTLLDRGLTTKAVRFYIRTEVDGVVYYEYLTRSLTIINYTPVLDPEVYDTNATTLALTGNKYILVRHSSNAAFTSGARGRKGATIDAQYVRNGEITKYTGSGTFEKVTSNEFYFTATDNYGRTVQETMQFSIPNGYWIEYIKPTANVDTTDMTADGDVGVTVTGKYFQGSFGAKVNKMRLHYDITKNGGEFEHVDLGYVSPYVSGTDYTYEFTIPNLDYMSVYELVVRVSDELTVEGAEAQTILASTPIFDWGRTDFNFNVPVNVEGDLTVAGNITAGGNTVPTIVAQGTAGIWTYRTWSDGTAECWGKKDVSVTFPSTANWGSLYTTGAISASNVSFPYGLFAETPVVNASLLIRSVGGILMAPGGNDSNKATWDQTGVYEIARGWYVSGTQYYTINYDVKGRWK